MNESRLFELGLTVKKFVILRACARMFACACACVSSRCARLWFGLGGAPLLLLNCCYAGADVFKLYPTWFEGSLDATFAVDVAVPDLQKHPLFRFARRHECILEVCSFVRAFAHPCVVVCVCCCVVGGNGIPLLLLPGIVLSFFEESLHFFPPCHPCCLSCLLFFCCLLMWLIHSLTTFVAAGWHAFVVLLQVSTCLLYTSPSPRDRG